MAIAALLIAAPIAAGAAKDNIPGVPLPAPSVSGRLGGSIYDVVYSVDVPAAHVLLLSLGGTPGTDFDLYVFNATATTVYSTVGQVASSTGPTSSESIAYPAVVGGTYYVDLSGATDVEGTYQLSVRIASDSTPPRVTLALNGGNPAVNTPIVPATVVAADDLSGVSEMQFSADDATWGAWQPYSPKVVWTFPPGDGPKDLWVRVRDRAGNISQTAHAAIIVDTVPPMIVARDPAPDDPVTGPWPTIKIYFSKPINVSSWQNYGIVLQDAAQTVVYGRYGWDPRRRMGTFVPGSPLVPGAVYHLVMGSIVDLAGNPLTSTPPWELLPKLLPRITLNASARLVAPGSSVVLSGRVGGVSGAGAGPVTLERSVGGTAWESVASFFPAPDGTFVTTHHVDANTSFRAVLEATATSAPASSPPARVLVRRGVSLVGVSSTVMHTVPASKAVSLTAAVSPSAPDVRVVLQVWQYDGGVGAYVLKTTLSQLSAGGRASFSWRPTTVGQYQLRVVTPPTPLYANGTSPAYSWNAT